jgi:hypothetical protein
VGAGVGARVGTGVGARVGSGVGAGVGAEVVWKTRVPSLLKQKALLSK